MSSQKMLELVEERALERFDRDFRQQIGHTSPERIETHLTVSLGPVFPQQINLPLI